MLAVRDYIVLHYDKYERAMEKENGGSGKAKLNVPVKSWDRGERFLPDVRFLRA